MFEFIKNFWNKRTESQSVSEHDEGFWMSIFGKGAKTNSGAVINENTALANSAVWGCIRILSDSVAILPLNLYRRVGDKNELIKDHPVSLLLNGSPNSEQTPFTFKKQNMLHRTTWGNSYAFIVRDNGGRPRQLIPLLPDRTTVWRNEEGNIYYQTRDRKGTMIKIRSEDMLHIPGLSYDGIVGKSVIGTHRETIGLAVSTQEFGARFFGQGAQPGGILSMEGKLDDDQIARLKKSFENLYAGNKNAHNVAVLEEGAKYEKLTIPPNDAQFLETRIFQAEDIARIYGVPLPLIQLMEKTSSWGSGIEQLMIAFVTLTLTPYLVAAEEAIEQKLLTAEERQTYYVKFNEKGLLRGDFKTRMEGYRTAKLGGWMNADEIRALEEMNPIKDGDIYYRPMSFIDISAPPQEDKDKLN